MEAALRTAYVLVTGENLGDLNVLPVRGLDGVKEATVPVKGIGDVKVAVAHGLGNARKLLDQVQAGEGGYHFIEIMACPGGCVGGGGQPQPITDAKRTLRAQALYMDDQDVQQYRQSHENPSIQKAYETFLDKPLGHKSHKLLHTHYTERGAELPHKK